MRFAYSRVAKTIKINTVSHHPAATIEDDTNSLFAFLGARVIPRSTLEQMTIVGKHFILVLFHIIH